MSRPPDDPDTRILSAADAAREFRLWLRHPEAAIRLQGVLADRLEILIRTFEIAAQERAEARTVSMDTVISALFGAKDLEAADPTANWRKFVQLLRAELENLECPLDIEFHKGRGSLRDRSVWISQTLSPSQSLAEEIARSPRLLPEPNDRFPEAHFVPPTLAVVAAGRIYPHIVARHLQRCTGAERLEQWPDTLRSRLRSLGATIRPVFEVTRSPRPPLIGFWLEPTDRGGSWPDAILPSSPEAPADSRRWFAAAWTAAAAATVRDLAALAREKNQAGLRCIVHFPAGWTPEYQDLSLFLSEWPELRTLLTLSFAEPESQYLVPLLKDLRIAWSEPFIPVIAPEAALQKWSNEHRVAAQPETKIFTDPAACSTLSGLVPESLRMAAGAARVPLLLAPPAENPNKAVWSHWLTSHFATSGWKGGSLVLGDSSDVTWEEFFVLGAQGRGGRAMLRSEGPAAEVVEVLSMLQSRGWQWKPVKDDPSGRLFDVSGPAANFRLVAFMGEEIGNGTPVELFGAAKTIVTIGCKTLLRPHETTASPKHSTIHS